MKTPKIVHFKYLKINFEYQNEYMTMTTEPFRTIGDLKYKAMRKFMIPYNNLKLFYMNKDITHLESEQIGTYFSGKNTITFKLVENTEVTSLPENDESLYLNSKLNIRNMFMTPKNINEINTSSSLNSNRRRVRMPKLLSGKTGCMKSQNQFKTAKLNSENINSSPSLNAYKETYSISPKFNIQQIKKNGLLKGKILNPLKLKALLNNREIFISNNDKNEYMKCKYCNYGNNISEYCRQCNKFLCSNCRKSEEHASHLTIRVNMDNLFNNLKLYGALLQSSIENNIDKNDEFNDTKRNKDTLLNGLNAKKQEIIRKLQYLSQVYERSLECVRKYLTRINDVKLVEVFQSYEKTSKEISSEIDSILNNLRNVHKNDKFKININSNNSDDKIKISYEEFITDFNRMHSFDEKLSTYSHNFVKLHLISEIDGQMLATYENIEKTINELVSEKNLFKIGENYNIALKKMKGTIADSDNELFPSNGDNDDNEDNVANYYYNESKILNLSEAYHETLNHPDDEPKIIKSSKKVVSIKETKHSRNTNKKGGPKFSRRARKSCVFDDLKVRYDDDDCM